MNANELRPLLVEYRSQVEQAWTVETAHPDFAGKAGHPVGQCGVTSAWLKRRLFDDHGLSTWFCIGNVWINSAWSPQHCRLEVGYKVVLDLTASQLGEPLREITCEDRIELFERTAVLYQVLDLRSSEAPTDPGSRRRLDALTEAVGR